MSKPTKELELSAVKFVVTTVSVSLQQYNAIQRSKSIRFPSPFSLALGSFLHLLEVVLQPSWIPGFPLAARQDQGLVSLPALAVLNF